MHTIADEKSTNRRQTRSSDTDVIVPNYRTTMGRKGFSYRGPQMWNTLTVELKNLETVNGVKNAYIRELLRDVNHPG